MEIRLLLVLLSSTLLTLAAAASVRLVDGGHRCEGRVEVLHDGQWGTVCDDQWDRNGAAVVCNELHCGEPLNAVGFAHFGQGTVKIWTLEVSCTGSESTLTECGSILDAEDVCNHVEDAGVICSGENVRLVVGPHQCSGRVEVFHRGSWSTVCDDEFDQQDAAVVCRELDCGIPVEVLGSAAFGRGEDQVLMEELQCRGNESEIHFCPTSSSSSSNRCSHDNDVGLICSGHTAARLMDGPDSCSGRVEIQSSGKWGTVCAVGWDMRAADVLCTQLGCGSAVAMVEVDWFGEGRGHIWADVFDCRGTETHLSLCGATSWGRAACSHTHSAGVICNGSSMALHEGRVQLYGESECQGDVEIYFRKSWRRVLLDSWRLSAASVLCRQLGCGAVLKYSSSSLTTEHNHTCVTGFSCSGNEAHLGNCSGAHAVPVNCSGAHAVPVNCSGAHAVPVNCSGTHAVPVNCSGAHAVPVNCSGAHAVPVNCSGAHAVPVNCSSEEQLHITCAVPKSIRLVGSGGRCAGRLEVFHSGSWGTVCDDSWDIKDAQVVCRQLQCGEALGTHIPAWFGPGTGSILLNEVECEGNETSLWNCRFQPCEETECGHQEDVGVVCTEFHEIRLTEGCKGNLEVFYNGTWGNVCGNGMTLETANTVCRELNCGTLEHVTFTAKARVESAPNWLDNVKCRKHDFNVLMCPSSDWGQNKCVNRNEVVHINCKESGSSLGPHEACSSGPLQKYCSNHWPLRLSGGKGNCLGMLEVFYNASWISVCDDQWDVRNAQVVCRQLGCGSALSADRNVTSDSGRGNLRLNRVKCRGNEIHLQDCYYSLRIHTGCSYAGVTCADPNKSVVSLTIPPTTTATTTTTTATTKSVRAERNPTSPGAPSPPLLVPAVLGTLLFLAVVLLLLLFYRNRALRRAVATSQPEAVYEELNRRFLSRRSKSFPQTGSLLYEEEHSGYEHVADEHLSVNSGIREKPEDYDDVINTGDIIGEAPKDYADDAVTAGPDDCVQEDETETYDDAVTADHNSVLSTEGVSESYDDAVTTETNTNIGAVDNPDDYDDVITKEQDAGETEEYDDVEEIE